jgi:hypothetical protein
VDARQLQVGEHMLLHPPHTWHLARVGGAIKHPSFKEEREWRLIAVPSSFEGVKYRAHGSLIVPYLDLPIPKDGQLIKEIVVGPCRYPDLALRSIRLMSAAQRGWPLKVTTARTPFRQLR